MFTTRIDKELLRKLKILAVNKERPANELIEEALKYLFKKYEKKK
jgi:predicted transcriptional regulator